jgi:hypothetical protein
MAGCAVPEAEIAIVISIGPKRLHKRFRQELDIGHITGSARVAATSTGLLPQRPRGGHGRYLLAES